MGARVYANEHVLDFHLWNYTKTIIRLLLKRANVERLSEEVRRRRWRFIGHILRKQPDNDCVTALTWTPEGKRKWGRPKTTWRRTVEKERSEAGWQSWREARTAAQDGNRWKAHVEALCATLAPGDKSSEVNYSPPAQWISVNTLPMALRIRGINISY